MVNSKVCLLRPCHPFCFRDGQLGGDGFDLVGHQLGVTSGEDGRGRQLDFVLAGLGRIWVEVTDTTLTFSFTGLVIASIIYSLPFAEIQKAIRDIARRMAD